MSQTPHGAIRVARAAGGRLRLRRTVVVLGRLLAVGGATALVLVGLERGALLDTPRWVLVAAPLVAASVLAIGFGLARRVSPAAAAGVVDEALALRDRLRNAIELASAPRGADPAFVTLSVAESERVAPRAQARRAIPLRWEWTWVAWGVTLLLAITLAAALPRRETGAGAGHERITLAQRERAAESLADTTALVRELAASDPELDDASLNELDAIESLEAELSEGRGDPEQALTESADALERLADEMDERAEQRAMERDEFERLARELEADAASPEMQRLADAIRSGDLERAREAASDLLNTPEPMSPSERERLASELESLAQQLEQSAASDTPPGQTPPPREASADDASTPDAQPEQPSGSEPEPSSRAEPAASDPAAPADRADDTSQEQQPERPDPIRDQAERREAAREQAERDARDLSDALRDAAEQTRRQGEPRDDAPNQSERRPDPQNRQGAGDDASPAGDQRDQPSPPDSADPGDRQPQPDASGAEQGPEPQQSPQPGEQQSPSEQQPQPEPGDQQPGDQQPGAEQPSESEQGEPRDAGEQQGEQGDGQKPDAGQQPSPRPGQPGADQQPQPSSQDTPPTDGSRPTQQETPGGAPEPGAQGPSLDEQLRRMAERRDSAPRQRESAQRLRDRARELLGDRPDEAGQRRSADGGDEEARQLTPPAGAQATDTETFDARPPDAERPEGVPEQVVADWYAQDKMERDPTARRAASEQLREAARSAERAVEQQTVPHRHRDLIRRLNERFLRRASELPEAPAPLGADADADEGSP